jgi:hypothetical protein
LLFFNRRKQACIFAAFSTSQIAAPVRIQEQKVLPLDFALSFDNFRTVRMCRLIWRQSDLLGMAFES